MRKILRRVAHAKMARAGLRRVNKRGGDGKSYFSKHWRQWA